MLVDEGEEVEEEEEDDDEEEDDPSGLPLVMVQRQHLLTLMYSVAPLHLLRLHTSKAIRHATGRSLSMLGKTVAVTLTLRISWSLTLTMVCFLAVRF